MPFRQTTYEGLILAWLCSFISIKFVALRLGTPGLYDVIFAGAAFAVAAIAAPQVNKTPYPQELRFGVLSAIICFAALLTIYTPSGAVLPAYDPIAVPTIAKIISEGKSPLDYYSPSDLAYSYPPGYPILFSYVVKLFGLDALFIFKTANLAVVASIPLAWALQVRALFQPGLPSRWIILGSYLAFFGLERTISFALPGAGKNSMLLAALVAPVLLVTLFRLADEPKKWLAGGIVFFGAILLHYSILYMAGTFFAGYVIYSILTRKIGSRKVAGFLFMGCVGLLALMLLFPEALKNPQTGELGAKISLDRTRFIWDTITEKYSVIFAIYNPVNNLDFGFSPSPYMGLLLAGCLGFAFSIAETRSLAATYALAILVSLVCGYGVVSVGLQLPAMRWYVWTFDAVALLACLLALLTLAPSSPRMVYLALLGITAFGFVRIAGDTWWVYHRAELQKLTTDDLVRIPNLIKPILRPAQPCYLVGQSKTNVMVGSLSPGMFSQPRKDLDYLEYTTACRYLNGSWIQGGAPGGRELNGFPAVSVLRTASQRGPVMFVGTDTGLDDMKKSILVGGHEVTAEFRGRSDEIAVWLLH
jgi:hypothetical protein